MITLISKVALLLVSTTAFAHEGHNHAPKGPYTVTKVEKAWVECKAIKATTIRRFASPFDRAVLHEEGGYKNDFIVLLGKDVELKIGDVLKNPVLATETCDHPYAMTCNEQGQPNSPNYKGTLKDIYCSEKINFVLASNKDKEKI